MSTHGLDVFDRTFEATHIWLNDICSELGPDKHVAWKVLSVVLQKLRDRLPLPLAAHLGAQLPLLVRGIYYDQFEPGRLPAERKTREDFIHEVAASLKDSRPVNPEQAIRCVFGVISRHVSEGQVRKIRDAMPHGFKVFWEAAEEEAPTQERRQHATGNEEPRQIESRQRTEEPLILTEAQQI